MIYSGAYGSAAFGSITGVTVPVVVQTRTGKPAAILVTTSYPQVSLVSTNVGNPLPLVSARHDTITI